MDYQHVLYQKQEAVARITLNRPEKLNVFDFPVQGGILDEFYAALEDGHRAGGRGTDRPTGTAESPGDYAITPGAAGKRARGILTRLTPEVPFHALPRHRVFLYP